MNEIETTSMSSLATVLAAAERDPAFRARLLENGGAALAELGLAPAPGVTVKVIEETPDVLYLVLPALPTLEMAGDDLDQIAGGLCIADDLSGMQVDMSSKPVPRSAVEKISFSYDDMWRK